MKTQCAWCSRDSGRIDPPGTSHGICPMHAEIELNKVKAAQIEREIDRCETRVRRKFHDYTRHRLPVAWDEEEPAVAPASGQRLDQLVYSALVLAAAIGAGVIAGGIIAGWRFLP
jgi:hypothetical protein